MRIRLHLAKVVFSELAHVVRNPTAAHCCRRLRLVLGPRPGEGLGPFISGRDQGATRAENEETAGSIETAAVTAYRWMVSRPFEATSSVQSEATLPGREMREAKEKPVAAEAFERTLWLRARAVTARGANAGRRRAEGRLLVQCGICLSHTGARLRRGEEPWLHAHSRGRSHPHKPNSVLCAAG